jgi:glycosyltransferase involved in cell wall biosynthesis
MSPPFISFLTSAYRTKRCVGETIDSVLPQTRPDWQLIAVENGNSDEMAWAVEKYTGDLRIQLVQQKYTSVRGGVTAAADVATGRYLCPLGSVRIDGGRAR